MQQEVQEVIIAAVLVVRAVTAAVLVVRAVIAVALAVQAATAAARAAQEDLVVVAHAVQEAHRVEEEAGEEAVADKRPR